MIYSASAHPGMAVAARVAKLPVFTFCRASQHSLAHGKQLAKEMLFRHHYRLGQGSTAKRPLLASEIYIQSEVLGDQVVLFTDVAPRPGTKAPGMDILPGNVGELIMNHVQSDLVTYQLSVTPEGPKGRGLTTARPLRDGDMALPKNACLRFSSKASLQGFLCQDIGMRDRVIKTTGIMTESGVETTLYSVPLGALQLVQHYGGIRKFPNCKLVAVPSEGPNDTFLQLVVCTANGAGVAAGSELLIDYGKEFDFSCLDPDASENSRKKWKGSLDVYFSRHASAAIEESGEAMPPEGSGGEPQKTAVEVKPAGGASGQKVEPAAAEDPQLKHGASSGELVPPPGAPGGDVNPATPKPVVDFDMLFKTTAPFSLQVSVSKEGTYHLQNLERANKKLGAKTFLHEWTDGKVTASENDDLMAFSDVSLATLVWSRDSKELMDLKSLIKKFNVKSVWGFEAFPAAAPPQHLKWARASPSRFVPTAPNLGKQVAGIQRLKKIGVFWSIKHISDRHALEPKALALITKKQIVLSAGVSQQMD